MQKHLDIKFISPIFVTEQKTTYTMKELLKAALEAALAKAIKVAPKTKNKVISVDITDVMPIDIPAFMEENNIPKDADFEIGKDSSELATGELFLVYNVVVPTTDEDKAKAIKKRFNSYIAFKAVFDVLTANGYKRVGSCPKVYQEFKNTTLYAMYMAEDFDSLQKYFLGSFEKIS